VNEPIIPLIYPKGYSVQGMDVLGRYGKRLKDGRHGHISLYAKGEKTMTASRCKIVWAARHNIDIRTIPKEYSFWLADDGTLQCDTFNARMSMIASVKAKEIKVKREEYEFTEKYAHLALQMLDGNATAKARLFSLINGKRDELIAYARRAKGGGITRKSRVIHRHGNILHLRPYPVRTLLCSLAHRERQRAYQYADNTKSKETRNQQKNRI
jgi:hypothetical protein